MPCFNQINKTLDVSVQCNGCSQKTFNTVQTAIVLKAINIHPLLFSNLDCPLRCITGHYIILSNCPSVTMHFITVKSYFTPRSQDNILVIQSRHKYELNTFYGDPHVHSLIDIRFVFTPLWDTAA